MTQKLKESAIDFLQLIVENRIEEAYTKHVDMDMIHHNPYFEGTREALKKAMEKNAKEAPKKELKIHNALEEGNYVSVFSHIKQNATDIGMAVIHIFKFHVDKIIELWSVDQAIPETSVNKIGFF